MPNGDKEQQRQNSIRPLTDEERARLEAQKKQEEQAAELQSLTPENALEEIKKIIGEDKEKKARKIGDKEYPVPEGFTEKEQAELTTFIIDQAKQAIDKDKDKKITTEELQSTIQAIQAKAEEFLTRKKQEIEQTKQQAEAAAKVEYEKKAISDKILAQSKTWKFGKLTEELQTEAAKQILAEEMAKKGYDEGADVEISSKRATHIFIVKIKLNDGEEINGFDGHDKLEAFRKAVSKIPVNVVDEDAVEVEEDEDVSEGVDIDDREDKGEASDKAAAELPPEPLKYPESKNLTEAIGKMPDEVSVSLNKVQLEEAIRIANESDHMSHDSVVTNMVALKLMDKISKEMVKAFGLEEKNSNRYNTKFLYDWVFEKLKGKTTADFKDEKEIKIDIKEDKKNLLNQFWIGNKEPMKAKILTPEEQKSISDSYDANFAKREADKFAETMEDPLGFLKSFYTNSVKEVLEAHKDYDRNDATKNWKAINKEFAAMIMDMHYGKTNKEAVLNGIEESKGIEIAKVIQKALKDVGYTEVGKEDGRIGPKTMAALAGYLEKVNLKEPAPKEPGAKEPGAPRQDGQADAGVAQGRSQEALDRPARAPVARRRPRRTGELGTVDLAERGDEGKITEIRNGIKSTTEAASAELGKAKKNREEAEGLLAGLKFDPNKISEYKENIVDKIKKGKYDFNGLPIPWVGGEGGMIDKFADDLIKFCSQEDIGINPLRLNMEPILGAKGANLFDYTGKDNDPASQTFLAGINSKLKEVVAKIKAPYLEKIAEAKKAEEEAQGKLDNLESINNLAENCLGTIGKNVKDITTDDAGNLMYTDDSGEHVINGNYLPILDLGGGAKGGWSKFALIFKDGIIYIFGEADKKGSAIVKDNEIVFYDAALMNPTTGELNRDGNDGLTVEERMASIRRDEIVNGHEDNGIQEGEQDLLVITRLISLAANVNPAYALLKIAAEGGDYYLATDGEKIFQRAKAEIAKEFKSTADKQKLIKGLTLGIKSIARGKIDFKAELDGDNFANDEYQDGWNLLQKFCYRREKQLPGFTAWMRGKMIEYKAELEAQIQNAPAEKPAPAEAPAPAPEIAVDDAEKQEIIGVLDSLTKKYNVKIEIKDTTAYTEGHIVNFKLNGVDMKLWKFRGENSYDAGIDGFGEDEWIHMTRTNESGSYYISDFIIAVNNLYRINQKIKANECEFNTTEASIRRGETFVEASIKGLPESDNFNSVWINVEHTEVVNQNPKIRIQGLKNKEYVFGIETTMADLPKYMDKLKQGEIPEDEATAVEDKGVTGPQRPPQN